MEYSANECATKDATTDAITNFTATTITSTVNESTTAAAGSTASIDADAAECYDDETTDANATNVIIHANAT